MFTKFQRNTLDRVVFVARVALLRRVARSLVQYFTLVCLLVSSLLFTAPNPVRATSECLANTDGDTWGDCAFMSVYTAVDGRIVVKYWGNQDFDFYQLRWSRPGRGDTQLRVRGSGSRGSWWALSNAWKDTPYTFKVQACYSDFLGNSDCTGWKEITYQKGSREVWR